MKMCTPYRQIPRYRQCRAISLIEIVVAMSVVAILSMFLISGFQSVRASSGAVHCAANLRGLMMAGISWSTDNEGYLPDRTYWAVVLRGSSTDRWSLYPYLGIPEGSVDEDSVLTCPTLVSKYKINSSSVVSKWHRTYGINMYTVGSISGSRDQNEQSSLEFSYRKLDAIPFPLSEVAFFFDGPVTITAPGVGSFNQMFQYPEFRDADIGVKGSDYIHSGAIHVVFLDGRVERITREQAIEENLTDRSKPLWARKP